MGYCHPSGLEKTLCKWDVYVPLVTKGLSGVPAVRPPFVRVSCSPVVAGASKNVPRKHEFCEKRYSESRTVPTGVNKFWSLYSTFFVGF